MLIATTVRDHRLPLLAALLSCCLFIISRLLYFTLSSLTDGLLILLLQLLAWLAVVAGIIITIYFVLRHRKRALLMHIIPLLFYIPTIVSPMYAHYTSTSIDIDTYLKQSEREAIVPYIIEKYSSGQHKSNEFDVMIDLPRSNSFLSDGGGQVIVRKEGERMTVKFYVWRGFLDSSSGFVVYTSDSSDPQAHSASRIKDHWFFSIE